MKRSKLYKRLSAWVLTLLMAVSILPVTALGEENYEALGNNGAIWARVKDGREAANAGLRGSGTQEDPYLLETAEDMAWLSQQVAEGNSYEGEYLLVTQDITLTEGWSGIGPASYSGSNGVDLKAFSGTFDGGSHTITIPFGGKGLFNYLREATIQNLKVQGTYINGCALLNNYIVDYGQDGSYSEGTGGSYNAGCPDTACFDNVHLVGNTKISGSGFASGDASGGNVITIQNCSVGSGVTVGCDASGNSRGSDGVGSFGGIFNGRITASSSAATVLGRDHVGGLIGGKGQSMGPAKVENCIFSGTVRASGNFVGGIVGSGYLGGNGYEVTSAPNTPCVSILGSSVTGQVSGSNAVGGIFGGEEGLVQCWVNGIGTIQDNAFSGSLTASGSHAGGIIGYMNSLNVYNRISGNTYTTDCGADKGIGGAKYIDTNYAGPTPIDGVIYVDTSLEMPPYEGFVEWDHNREDDPLGVSANTLATNGAMTALTVTNYKDQYFKGENFTLAGAEAAVTWSNHIVTPVDIAELKVEGFDSSIEGTQTVILRYQNLSCEIQVTVTAAKVTSLTISGDYQKDYFLGQTLNLSSAVITATFEDGSVTHPTQNNLTIEHYDPNQEGTQTVTLVYGGQSCVITVTVRKPWVTKLEISGSYKTIYEISDPLNLAGATITATWADGSITHPSVAELDISGFDSDSPGSKTVTLTYKGKSTTMIVTVKKPSEETINVTFTLLGDSSHGENGGTHTLATGGLQTWIPATTYTIPKNSTVKVLFEKALKEYGMTWTNPSGNYVASITRNGVKLGEFTNGKLSGWMYTLNGTHPDWGVAEQKLKNGDKVVWHYTDDYTKEQGSDNYTPPSSSTGTSTGTTADAGAESVTQVSEASAEQRLLATGDYLFNTVKQPTVGSIGGEWAVLGLARAGYPVPQEYFETYYENVEQYVTDCEGILHEKKYTDYSRVALALTAIGKDPRDVAGYNLLAPLADFDKVIWQGINGPIWALIALDSANYPVPEAPAGVKQTTRESLIAYILENEIPGGGWSLGDTADVDITAMAMQALAPYCDADPQVKAAVERSLTVLSQKQSDLGSFSNGTERNAESCAQVIVALSALGIDLKTEERFLKNGRTVLDALCDFAVDGGGFRHVLEGEVNGMATEQAYYALAAYDRMGTGKTRLYDMTDIQDYGGDVVMVETTEPTEPVQEDAKASSFPWWAVILVVLGGSAGALLWINRKKF